MGRSICINPACFAKLELSSAWGYWEKQRQRLLVSDEAKPHVPDLTPPPARTLRCGRQPNPSRSTAATGAKHRCNLFFIVYPREKNAKTAGRNKTPSCGKGGKAQLCGQIHGPVAYLPFKYTPVLVAWMKLPRLLVLPAATRSARIRLARSIRLSFSAIT